MRNLDRKYLISLILILVIISLSFESSVIASDPFVEPDPGDEGKDKEGASGGPNNEDINPLLNKIVSFFLKITGNYNLGSGFAPKYFSADPYVLEVDYLGNASTDITFGHYRRNATGYQEPILDDITLYFKATFPENIQKEAWNIYFDPPVLDLRKFTEDLIAQGVDPPKVNPKTKMCLFLDAPADPDNPIQDFELTVNVTIERKYTNLVWSGAFGGPIVSFFSSLAFRSVFNEHSVGTKSCQVFVKVKPYRYAELYVPNSLQMGLNDVRNVQLQVENRGSHIERFGFRLNNNGSDSLFVTPPAPITLSPGKTGTVNIGLMTGLQVYDRGTLHKIKIEVYPVDQPNVTVAVNEFGVLTQGVALQGIFTFKYSWHLFFVGIIVIICGAIYLFMRRLKLTEICKKPPKPWTLPEEKEYLDKLLKEKKTEEHEKTLKMMKEEYDSALLWYESYREFLIKEKRKEGKLKKLTGSIAAKFSDISKKAEKKRVEKKKKVEKPEKKESDVKQKIIKVKPEETKKDEKKEIVDKILEREKRKREKALQKIKNKQEKQKRKLGI